MSSFWSIDEICDEFEEAWHGPDVPAIADFVQRIDLHNRDRLLKHLEPIYIEKRLQRGLPVSPDNYDPLGSIAKEIVLLEDNRISSRAIGRNKSE